MSGRCSPLSDAFSGVGEHFCFKGGVLDFDLSSEDDDMSLLGYTPPCLQTDAAYLVRDQQFREKVMTSQKVPRCVSYKQISSDRKGSMAEDASGRGFKQEGPKGVWSKDSSSKSLMSRTKQQMPQRQQQVHSFRKEDLTTRTIHVTALSSRILPIPSSFATEDTSFKFTDAFWDHLEKFRSNPKFSIASNHQLHNQGLGRGFNQFAFSFRTQPNENVLS